MKILIRRWRYKTLVVQIDKWRFFFLSIKMIFLFIILHQGCERKGGIDKPLPRFTQHCWDPVWSPDGKTIAFGYVPWVKINKDSFIEKLDSSGIFLIDADGKNKRPFLISGFLPSFHSPDFSPDGKWLAFIGGPGGEYNLHKAKINGDSIIPLTSYKNYWDRSPKWTPDGKKILFIRVGEPLDSAGLCLINADGSKIKVISSFCGKGDFLPDYKFVSTCWINGKKSIWIIDTTGLNIKMISDFPGEVSSCSPDGKKILLTTYNESTMSYEIWVMNVDETNLKRLCIDGIEPSWSPDGTKIVYVKYNMYKPATKYPGYGELWIMDANGLNHKQLTYPD